MAAASIQAADINDAFTTMKDDCRAGIRHFVPPSRKIFGTKRPLASLLEL
jgi:hypothetical protein